jgi:hypothetical protein
MMGCVFLIFLVFCVVVGWGACFLSSLFSVLWYDGVRVSYLLSFLCCGRMGSVFLIFLVFCVVVRKQRR